MLKVRYSKQFKKDFKLAKKRGLPLQELKDILEKLANGEVLEEKLLISLSNQILTSLQTHSCIPTLSH